MADAKIILSAVDQTSAAFATAQKNLLGLGRQAANLSATLGGIGATGAILGLVRLVQQSADAIDAFTDLNDATGASIENISALDRVARDTGVGFDTVASILVKFNKVLNDAGDSESEAAGVLKALSLNAEELKKIDPAEALRQTAVALAGFADNGAKARGIQLLFNKSTQEAASFLKDLAEQGKLVAAVTTEQAEEAKRFNKEMFKLKTNIDDVSRSMSMDLVEGINKAAKAWRESGLVDGIRTLLTGDDEYKNNKRLVELTDDLFRAENDLSQARSREAKYGDKSLASGAAERRVAAIKAELAIVQAYRKVLDDTKPTASGLPGLSVPSNDDKKREEERKKRAKALADELKKLREKDIDGWVKYADAVLEEGDRIDAELRKQAEGRNQETENLLKQDLAGWVAYAQARVDEDFDMARQIADQQIDALGKTNSMAKELGMTFSSAFEDAVISGKEFSQVLGGIGNDILRIGMRKNITKPFTDAIGELDFGKLWPFANGGVMSSAGSLPLHAYASGGIASSPQLAVFGEGRMNEAFVPLPDGRSIPVSMRGGGSSMTVNIIESPGNGGQQSRRTENGVDILDVMVEKIKSSIAGDISRGSGAVPGAMSRTYGLNRVAGSY